jgi:hypothetical protein
MSAEETEEKPWLQYLQHGCFYSIPGSIFVDYLQKLHWRFLAGR